MCSRRMSLRTGSKIEKLKKEQSKSRKRAAHKQTFTWLAYDGGRGVGAPGMSLNAHKRRVNMSFPRRTPIYRSLSPSQLCCSEDPDCREQNWRSSSCGQHVILMRTIQALREHSAQFPADATAAGAHRPGRKPAPHDFGVGLVDHRSREFEKTEINAYLRGHLEFNLVSLLAGLR